MCVCVTCFQTGNIEVCGLRLQSSKYPKLPRYIYWANHTLIDTFVGQIKSSCSGSIPSPWSVSDCMNATTIESPSRPCASRRNIRPCMQFLITAQIDGRKQGALKFVSSAMQFIKSFKKRFQDVWDGKVQNAELQVAVFQKSTMGRSISGN